ncbi:TPA: Ldh family oxidoreductase, partial [Candidatus Bathyarchaeota archaeon]|nr:Ldh family oxidoreductase [Candidatus Bathyarchaeota archaeon]
MPIFKAEMLRRLSEEIFVAYGAPAEEAKLVSEFLVKANLCGHDSHGVIRVIQYVKAIEDGILKPSVKIDIIKETRSSALLKGNWGFGQVIAKRAMELAIEKAKKNSVSVVCAFDLYHIGRLADYTMFAAENKMIGIAMVNSTPTVAPYGGRERLISTAPISYAFPTGKEKMFVLDIATSVCAEGKVRVSLHKGENLPEGCIIDKEGNPSTNPADLYEGGAILP